MPVSVAVTVPGCFSGARSAIATSTAERLQGQLQRLLAELVQVGDPATNGEGNPFPRRSRFRWTCYLSVKGQKIFNSLAKRLVPSLPIQVTRNDLTVKLDRQGKETRQAQTEAQAKGPRASRQAREIVGSS